jgi:S1-C subfamily serine protease
VDNRIELIKRENDLTLFDKTHPGDTMKKCPNPDCNQILGETITTCPTCGTHLNPALVQVDDYALIKTMRETSTGILYCARRSADDHNVMLRLYPEETAFSSEKAEQINQELMAVSTLSNDAMVQHIDLRQSANGRWYRVSEWIESVSWGDLMAERFFRDPRNKKEWIGLFTQMASALNILHKSERIMPYMSLNDFLLFKGPNDQWKIKLDYKLYPISAGLQQAPMELQAFLSRHPDFKANRFLDVRSDIYTLGRLMLELLLGTNKVDDCQELLDKIYQKFEPIVFHRKLSGLLRAMIDDDPDKRTSSMENVIKALAAITDEDIAKWNKFAKDPTKTKKLGRKIRFYAIAATCIVIGIVVFLTIHQRWQTNLELERVADENRQEASRSVQKMEAMIQGEKGYFDQTISEQLARTLVSMKEMLPEQRRIALTEKYRRSVAFVLTEYYLYVGGKLVPVGSATGTAFLVSSDGYLLTNRHVACPWLSEKEFEEVFQMANERGIPITLKYNHYLWFDGDQAFRTIAGGGSKNIEDQFKLNNAYRSDGKNGKKVEFLGAMQVPQELVDKGSSLQDDVAVLRINSLPVDAVPVPLRIYEDGKNTPKGTAVFALGFPYGQKSIVGDSVVTRCTDGTISRVFENALNTNADLHPGNSGGPLIDLDGFAIGIVTSRMKEYSSMGYIYPIHNARLFLDSVRMGNPQWKGMPTFTFEVTLEKARSATLAGDTAAATQMMNRLLEHSPHPGLFFWAGILAVEGDNLTDSGKALMKNALKLEPRNALPQFMLYRADFLAGVDKAERAYCTELTALDWRHPQEFIGYLMRVLDGNVPVDEAVAASQSTEEETFVYWAASSMEKKRGNNQNHLRHLQAAWITTEKNSPLAFLIQTEMMKEEILPEIDKQKPSVGKTEDEKSVEEILAELQKEKQPSPQQPADSNSRIAIIQEAYKITSKGLWHEALSKTEQYLAMPNRESANTLGMGLLRCQLLYLIGDKQKAEIALKEYIQRVHAPWYRSLADGLLGTVSEESLRAEAVNSREKTITLAVALGLKAEADGEKPKAIECYNDALDTGMVNWLEFELAKARRESIRPAVLIKK